MGDIHSRGSITWDTPLMTWDSGRNIEVKVAIFTFPFMRLRMNTEKYLPVLETADGCLHYVRNLKALSQHRLERISYRSMGFTVLSLAEEDARTPCTYAKLFQLCLTLWDPVDHNPPGFSVRGISQGRTLEWVAMPSSRVSSWFRDWTCISYVSRIGRWILYH